jgi:hypothetical protein
MRISRFLPTPLASSLATICACGGATIQEAEEAGGQQEAGVTLVLGGGSSSGGSSSGGTSFQPTQNLCAGQRCDGCCDLAPVCQPGDKDTACGTNGAACQDCAQAGGTCVAGGCVGTSTTFGASATDGGNASNGPGGGFPGFPGFDGGPIFTFPRFDAGALPAFDGGVRLPAFDGGFFRPPSDGGRGDAGQSSDATTVDSGALDATADADGGD